MDRVKSRRRTDRVTDRHDEPYATLISRPIPMTLLLSTDVLPAARLSVIRRGAERRDFAGVEWVVGGRRQRQAFAMGSPPQQPQRDDDIPVRWLLLRDDASVPERLFWGRQAHLAGAGLVLPVPTSDVPLGIPLALLHPTDPDAASRAAAWATKHDARTCWEVSLSAGGPDPLNAVADITMERLAHVRIRGAGPEGSSSGSTDRTVGTVLKALALRGYDGSVALTCSTEGATEDWRRWLFDERGWGCNTAAEKKAAR